MKFMLLAFTLFVVISHLQAESFPSFKLPASQQGDASVVHLLSVDPIGKQWLNEKGFHSRSHGLRLIFLVVAKDPAATDFAISPKAWVKINGTDYLGISNHLLKEDVAPYLLVAELGPDYLAYAESLEVAGQVTKIVDAYFPGVEHPSVETLEARIFAGWFRKGESFEFKRQAGE
ncbi:hypothetical protein QEH56_13820 [Pelagicoccus enzymogenes]|uniref:hypothetical protein n=1 Tax=Pelagicoccus enzymogenes TaxID=2773457 RepID=UPI00280FF578|nr:hypothetical protein [Pelagicoccus enzymogenes]MDQ8199242.1 hypothetical protein [Pelagicoccus enzymogenes]